MPPMGRGARDFLTDEEMQNKPQVTKELLVRVFSWLKPYYKQMLLVLGCIFVSSVFTLLPSVLTGRIIDEGLIGRDLTKLVTLIVLSLLVTLGANLIGVAESYLNSWIAEHITFDMRGQMYWHLQKMSQSFFTTNNQGDIITRMTSDISGVKQVISGTLTSIISNVVTLIVALVVMYRANWVLATIGIIIVPLFAIPTRTAGKSRWELTREAQNCNDEINGILNETLSVSGQLLVKLFGREDYEYGKYKDATRKLVDVNIREGMAGRWFRVVISTVSSVGPMLLYLVGGILMMKYDSSLTVGDITVLVALLGRMYGPVNNLLNIQVDWIRSMAMFTRIFEYFDLPVEIENAPDALTPAKAEGNVEFVHVDFRYNPERKILDDVSFKLNAGHSVAIVGPSGSGKSTIINLIPRLYDVEKGQVLFDGVDVRKLDLNFLRDSVGIVSQETYLFNGTIRENLLYAKPDATEEELIAACRDANILDFIEKQDKGLDAMVGNRGLKLSGGEKQRISIARVLLKNPALLVFDEATSALDSISESKIQEALDPLIATRTSILIAHRLSTILAADEILVVKEGRIVERGVHADLVKAGGVYTELYETQFKAALDVGAVKTQKAKAEDLESLVQIWRAAEGASQSFLPASYFDEKEKTMRQDISDAEVYVLNEAPRKGSAEARSARLTGQADAEKGGTGKTSSSRTRKKSQARAKGTSVTQKASAEALGAGTANCADQMALSKADSTGNRNVLGFIGVKDGSITGFFVDGPFQNQGLGKRLLDYVKERYEHLSLHVFEKNEGAVRFCKREGFVEKERRKDAATSETELVMEWKK